MIDRAAHVDRVVVELAQHQRALQRCRHHRRDHAHARAQRVARQVRERQVLDLDDGERRAVGTGFDGLVLRDIIAMLSRVPPRTR